MIDARTNARRWYASLLGVSGPVLVGGFVASALADRLVFAGWALAAAGLYTAALRWSWLRPSAVLRIGLPAAVVIVAVAAFVLLAQRHAEDLRIGWAAIQPLPAPSLDTGEPSP